MPTKMTAVTGEHEAFLLMIAGKLMSKDATDKAREDVEAGAYTVDATIRVKGTVNVGKDYEKTPTVSVPLKETLALLLHRMGFQRDTAIPLLREIMAQAIQAKKDIEAKVVGAQGALIASEFGDVVKDMMDTVETEFLAKLPKTKSKGPVTTKLNAAIVTVEPIGFTPAPVEEEEPVAA